MSKRRRPEVVLQDGQPKQRRMVDNDNENDMDMSQQPDFHCSATMADEGEVGLIEAVKLKNFMCHEKLDVKFGPHCNFLIGRNGSGKSAILTGIVVGLGGKATTTNRGNSIKGFIKSGKISAEIQITLRNRGTDAFKCEQYGKSITVCRKLCDGGGGGYKILSADGKIISQKKEELDHILDQFNIQVDNPVAILNQDTSRNFLHSKNATDKYMFFLKATQLEQMKHDYVRANESKEIAVGILTDKQATLPGLEQEVFEWEQKYKALASLEDLKKKVQKLTDEMAWALISEKEKELEQIAKSLKQEEARTPKFIQKVTENTDKVKECQARKKEGETKLKTSSKEVELLEPQHQKLKKKRDDEKKKFKNSQTAVRKFKHELESTKRERSEIQKRIEELKNSTPHDLKNEKSKRETRINTLKKKIEALEAQKITTTDSFDRFERAMNNENEKLADIKKDDFNFSKKIKDTEKEIDNLRSSRNKKMARYGPWMVDLLKKIDVAAANGRFHKKPLGPIGSFITAKDQKWALAIEICLKGLIHAFCVHDHHDERELEKVFNEARLDARKLTTITCPFYDRVYDVSRNAPRKDNRWTTVMAELEVTNPVIMNTLIDQRTVESVLLFEDKDQGRKIMLSEKPRNVREGFDQNGDQMYCQPTFRFYSNTSIAKEKFLSASVDDHIRSLEDTMNQYISQKSKVTSNGAVVDKEVKKNRLEAHKCDKQLKKIQQDIGNHKLEINELQNIEDPAPVDVTTLEEEIDNYNRKIEDQNVRYEKAIKQNTVEKEEMEASEGELKEIDLKIQAAIEQSDPIKESLAVIDNDIDIAKSHEQHYKAKMKEHEKKIDEMRKQHNDFKKDLDDSISKADQICSRMKTRRTAQNLESEINQINKRIKTEEKNRGNHEEITRKYHETFTKFKKIKKEVQQLTNFLKKLDNTMEVRQLWYIKKRASLTMRMKQFFIVHLSNRKYHGHLLVNHKEGSLYPVALDEVMVQRQRQYFEFRRMIALRAKYYFIVMLSNRKYVGKINFNHQAETLSIDVQPSTVNGEGAKDMKALSGGERSFATVCFILSLWDAMESPFRCLDEFDVFMDMVNRRISMDMMLDVAGKQKGRQFIFLTPQDMSSLAHKRNVRIFELRPPERGQTTINFTSNSRTEEEEEATEKRA